MTLKVVQEEQIGKIHETSLRVLREVGVEVPHEDMRRRFQQSGAKVEETGIVRIPEQLVEESLQRAGKTFTLYGRERSRKAVFGRGQRNYNSSYGQALWIDGLSTERRYATLADVATAARVGDALEHLTIVGAMSDPHELPPSYRCVEVAATLLRNTTKPVGLWFHDRASARYLVELLIAVSGNEEAAREFPLTHPFFEPISPLRFPHAGIDLLYETARLNLPVPVGPMAQAGMSAPVTLAGTLAQENAEILAGLCITQLIRPGMPVCYGGIPHAFDMRVARTVFSGPEQVLLSIAMTQMGKHYGLPVYINVGLTDSKSVDAQAGLECGFSLICGVLAGADIFGHLGICGMDQGSSLEMLLMQHELIGMVERVMAGLRVEEESLAFDVIDEVGPGGTFISHDHTAAHFREELWLPRLLDRNSYDVWLAAGSPTMAQRCAQEKESLLAEHQVAPLAEDTEKEVARVLDAARRHLANA